MVGTFLFPHKTIEGSDYYGMMNFDQIHRELAIPGVNLALLHQEYEVLCRTLLLHTAFTVTLYLVTDRIFHIVKCNSFVAVRCNCLRFVAF